MRAIAWILAIAFVAYGAETLWAAGRSLHRLSRVPSGRRRVAQFMVLSTFAGGALRVLIAITLLLATYDPTGSWKPSLIGTLVLALLLITPGLAMYLWHHHEPWIQDWRHAAGSKSTIAK